MNKHNKYHKNDNILFLTGRHVSAIF